MKSYIYISKGFYHRRKNRKDVQKKSLLLKEALLANSKSLVKNIFSAEFKDSEDSLFNYMKNNFDKIINSFTKQHDFK